MAPLSDVTNLQIPEPGFSVSHQKVELDFDLLSRSLKGKTELTIVPHSRDLRSIALNCRQCQLKNLTVNGKPAPGVKYENPYEKATLRWNAGVHQYHMLQERLEKTTKYQPEEELLIYLPKNIKLEELDPFSEEVQGLALSKTPGTKRDPEASVIDLISGTRTNFAQTARFRPITISVEYEIQRLRDGMQFVGFEVGDLRYPHAYSMNSSSPGAACCLFPCLDDITSRCTWEITIKCARTVGDALRDTKAPSSKYHDLTNGLNSSLQASNPGDQLDTLSDEDKAMEIAVVCTGDMTDEVGLDNDKNCGGADNLDCGHARPYQEDNLFRLYEHDLCTTCWLRDWTFRAC